MFSVRKSGLLSQNLSPRKLSTKSGSSAKEDWKFWSAFFQGKVHYLEKLHINVGSNIVIADFDDTYRMQQKTNETYPKIGSCLAPSIGTYLTFFHQTKSQCVRSIYQNLKWYWAVIFILQNFDLLLRKYFYKRFLIKLKAKAPYFIHITYQDIQITFMLFEPVNLFSYLLWVH